MTAAFVIAVVFVLAAAVLLGSIPFGVLVAKRRGVDLRERGSGNIGATNAARVLGLGAGVVVLVLDAAKGIAAVALASHVCGGWLPPAAGFVAILAHCFSPFLGFRGGKGVATALGVFAIVAPAFACIAIAVFLVVAGKTRIVALGSLAGIATATVCAFVTHADAPLRGLCVATLVLLVYTHRINLRGLFAQRV